MAKKAKSAFSSMAIVPLLAVLWAGYMAYLKTGIELLGLTGFVMYAWIKLFVKSKPLDEEKSYLKFWRFLYEAGLLLVTGYLLVITRMKDIASTDGAMNTLGALTAAMLVIFMAGAAVYFGPAEKSPKEPAPAAGAAVFSGEDIQRIKDKDAFTFNLMVVFLMGCFTLFYYEGDKMQKMFLPAASVKPAAEKLENAGETADKPGTEKQGHAKAGVMTGAAGKDGKKKHAAKPVKQAKNNISEPPLTEEKVLYPSGAVNMIWTKKNGVTDGPFKRFYPSGAIGQKGSYTKGAKDGDWYFYREDGSKFKTMIFDMDKVVLVSMYGPKAPGDTGPGKPSRSFQYIDGKLYRETIFENGKPKAMKYYDKDGQVVSTDDL